MNTYVDIVLKKVASVVQDEIQTLSISICCTYSKSRFEGG